MASSWATASGWHCSFSCQKVLPHCTNSWRKWVTFNFCKAVTLHQMTIEQQVSDNRFLSAKQSHHISYHNQQAVSDNCNFSSQAAWSNQSLAKQPVSQSCSFCQQSHWISHHANKQDVSDIGFPAMTSLPSHTGCYNRSSFLHLPFDIPYMPVFFFYDVFNLLWSSSFNTCLWLSHVNDFTCLRFHIPMTFTC